MSLPQGGGATCGMRGEERREEVKEEGRGRRCSSGATRARARAWRQLTLCQRAEAVLIRNIPGNN